MDEQKKGHGVTWAVVVVILALIAYGTYAYVKDDAVEESANNIVQPVGTSETTDTYEYKDGTYTVIGNYNSPGGAETIGVTLTLKDDVVVDADVEKKATRPISVNMQTAFEGGFASLVIGKKIDDVQLDKVSGSSLTPKGFNDAVAKIKVQAKA